MRLENWLYTLPLRLRSLFRGGTADRELDDEMQYHLEQLAQDHMARGMPAEEARYAALRAMEGLTQNKERARETRRISGLLNFGRDLRYALRLLRKNPGFSAVAILTLALGIGANSAIFSVVNAMLLRPLPFAEPERLVRLWETQPDHGKNVVNAYNFMDWRDNTHSFEDMAAVSTLEFNLTGGGAPLAVPGDQVSTGYFSILKVNPYLGRTFVPDDGVPGRQRVILSYGLWQERFGSDPEIVGKTISVDGSPSEVIGVMPRGFSFPKSRAQIWGPLPIVRSQDWLRGRFLTVVARLKPGVTLQQAQEDIDRAAKITAQLRPDFNRGWGATAIPLLRDVTEQLRKPLWVLLGAVAFLLLIGCANVANLLLMRGTGRLQEIAIRQSLGATRARIMQQLLAEGLVLAIGALAAGLVVAAVCLRGLLAVIPPTAPLPRNEPVTLDGNVFAFTVAASLLTAVLFALAPALRLSRVPPQEVLKSGNQQRSGEHRGLRQTLVVLEISLAIVLTIGAGLMTRSLLRLLNVDLGFDAHHVLSMRIFTSPAKYDDPHTRSRYMARMLDEVRAVPGVESAGTVHFLPLQERNSGSCFEPGARNPTPASSPNANFLIVSPGYFGAMKTPILGGRDFDPRDQIGSPSVMMVNQAFVRRFISGKNPIGQQFSVCWADDFPSPAEVVGVVADARQMGLESRAEPTIFLSNLQTPMYFAALVVRSHGEPAQITNSVLAAIHRADPEQAVSGIETLDEVMSDSASQPRFQAVLLLAFAGLALSLCAIGVYGVISYSVEQRRKEIGIRMALGAGRANVLQLIAREALLLTGIGLAVGLLASAVLTRLLGSLLFEITPLDPATLSFVSLLVMITAAAAACLPARKATKVDPMFALRYE
ncbi:MAG TPA: ABC transporter permease [Candidatus Angelobacter sp.]|nr:ABC transporter permease [Candidatus Angelobacter sp.]